MAHLIAQGESPQNRWRRILPADREIVLGRTASGWSTPWDDRISKNHAQLRLERGQLVVAKLPDARNPIFFQGSPQDRFKLTPGNHFVIGTTSFALDDEELGVTLDAPLPLTERTFSPQALERIPFRNAARQVGAMSRLPDIIAGASSDDELFVQLLGLVFSAIEAATFAAVVRKTGTQKTRGAEILHWDRRPITSPPVAPSDRLIQQAIDEQQSVVHIWQGESGGGPNFTQAAETDWAFCTPVRGDAAQGLAIYVAGGGPSQIASGNADGAHELQDSVKFTELVALTLAHLRNLQQLERHKSTLGQFISPLVLEAVSGRDPEAVLAPREAEVSVLFCDLRGFSQTSESSADNLAGLLERVSLALGVMTRHILAEAGVIGDFHGDSAMGFWGWPLPQDNAIERSCRSALKILAEFNASQNQGHPLTDFRVGIGIASGPAVAGKIGTVDQVKVTVFGPVVNLAARLEEMTKLLRAPILVDEVTAIAVRQHVPPDVARVRRVAKVRPYGLQSALEICQLLPPYSIDPTLSDKDIHNYEAALDSFLDGDWERAFELLHQVPAEDRVKDFLTVYIAQNNRTPPPDWDGVITLTRGVRREA